MRVHKIEPYDLVIDMQGLIKSAIIARIIPSKVTLGYDKNSLRESFAAIFYNKKFAIDYSENIIKRNVFVISRALGFDIPHNKILNKKPFLCSNSNNSNSLNNDVKPNIAFIPGASFKSKIYPVEKYIKLANELDANIIILWGNEEEKLIG